MQFIHQLILSQTKDLILLNNQQEMEEARYSQFYKKPWVQDAVNRYMVRKFGQQEHQQQPPHHLHHPQPPQMQYWQQ